MSAPAYWSVPNFQGNSHCTSSNLKTMLQHLSTSPLASYSPTADSERQYPPWASQSFPWGLSSPLHFLASAITALEWTASSSVFRFGNRTSSIHTSKSWPASTSIPPSSSTSIAPCSLWYSPVSQAEAESWKVHPPPSPLVLSASSVSLTISLFDAVDSQWHFVSRRFGYASLRWCSFVLSFLYAAGWIACGSFAALAGTERDRRGTDFLLRWGFHCNGRCSSCRVLVGYHAGQRLFLHQPRHSYARNILSLQLWVTTEADWGWDCSAECLSARPCSHRS